MDDLKTKLNKAVKDLSTLEVATFTKSDATTPVQVNMDFGPDTDVSTNNIFNGIRSALADKELIGYVRFELDGDTVAFVNNNSDYADVLEYHKEMIAAGQATRKDLYDTIVGLFKKD